MSNITTNNANKNHTPVIYIANGFSPNMVKTQNYGMISRESSLEELANVKDVAISYIGHEDTAQFLGVEYHRGMLLLEEGDTLFVVTPPRRLREGQTQLDKCDFEGMKVSMIKLIPKEDYERLL